MAFELLRTDYVDATFEGLRRYLVSENGDGTVSFHDVTNYTVKEGSFFGAKDANTINTAVNAILAALENGTDLYEVFIQFFELQKKLFLEESDAKQEDFSAYIIQLRAYMDGKWDELKTEYTGDIQYFKDVQENAFKVWFQMIRNQLSEDVAGKIQIQIDALNAQAEDIEEMLVTGNVVARIETDEGDYLTDDFGNPLFADWPICESDEVRGEFREGINSLRQQSESKNGELLNEINSLRQQSESKNGELLNEINNLRQQSESGDSGLHAEINSLRQQSNEGDNNLSKQIQQLNRLYNEVFQSVSEGKSKIASAFADIGVNMDADASFDAMAERISTLEDTPSRVSNVLFAPYSVSNIGVRTQVTFDTDRTIDHVDLVYRDLLIQNIESGYIIPEGDTPEKFLLISYSVRGAAKIYEGRCIEHM